MSRSRSGSPSPAAQKYATRVGHNVRGRKAQQRRWQRKNGPVVTTQLQHCPGCGEWMRDGHTCKT